jgi:hypothetical protein
MHSTPPCSPICDHLSRLLLIPQLFRDILKLHQRRL